MSASAVTRGALPAVCHMPLATAIAVTDMKHARYGNMHPRTVLDAQYRATYIGFDMHGARTMAV